MNSNPKVTSLHGKYFLVTGAAGRLGRVICDSLASMGANILLLDIKYSSLVELVKDIDGRHGVKCIPIECDLENTNDRERKCIELARRIPTLDGIVHNAAFTGDSALKGWSSKFEHQDLDSWRRAIEVNLTAPFHLTQLLFEKLKIAEGATIVNISSIYGEIGPDWSLYEGTSMGNPCAYAVSKAGLIQLTRWLATTLAPRIRVNSIVLGGIEREQPQEFIDRYSKKTLLKRMARENDIRGLIAFLCTDASSYMTGETVRLHGGFGY